MVSEHVLDEILEYLAHIQDLPYQLIVVTAPPGSGKTALLQQLSDSQGFPLVNVNLQLSDRLKELSEIQRILRAGQILGDIVDELGPGPVLLDNTEYLFEPHLKLDPLTLLKRISRNRPLVVAWNGVLDGKYLVYAHPGHPEYGRYQAEDTIVINLAPQLP